MISYKSWKKRWTEPSSREILDYNSRVAVSFLVCYGSAQSDPSNP